MAQSSKDRQGFAKLFGVGGDQIAVLLLQTPEGVPTINLFYDPRIEGLTISSSAVTFETPEKARQAFDALIHSQVRAYVEHRIAQYKEIIDGDPEPEPEELQDGGPGGE